MQPHGFRRQNARPQQGRHLRHGGVDGLVILLLLLLARSARLLPGAACFRRVAEGRGCRLRKKETVSSVFSPAAMRAIRLAGIGLVEEGFPFFFFFFFFVSSAPFSSGCIFHYTVRPFEPLRIFFLLLCFLFQSCSARDTHQTPTCTGIIAADDATTKCVSVAKLGFRFSPVTLTTFFWSSCLSISSLLLFFSFSSVPCRRLSSGFSRCLHPRL